MILPEWLYLTLILGIGSITAVLMAVKCGWLTLPKPKRKSDQFVARGVDRRQS